MGRVSAEKVVKRYGAVAALDGVSLTFEDGELFGLLGPSGSGKTTLLRMIAGFIQPDEGAISFDGERVDHIPVNKRAIGMVFQSYALFPHLTVDENIGFGLSVRGVGKAEIGERVAQMLDLVQLEGLGGRKPRQLSGGQQQRVALARALITDPKVLLLDEPLGALDRRLRQEMQVELRQLQRKLGITTIFVTHDQEEALTLSDRVAIINEGRIAQVGRPHDVYERPGSVFAAQFLGDANVMRGKPDGNGLVLGGGLRIETAGPCAGTAIVRPEKLAIERGHRALGGNALHGTVMQSVYAGALVTYRVDVPAAGPQPFLALAQTRSPDVIPPGEEVTLSWPAAHTVPVAP
jgi:spermidine/putrescine ABC transporter ATP-binding subunit